MKLRRLVAVVLVIVVVLTVAFMKAPEQNQPGQASSLDQPVISTSSAIEALNKLAVKGRAPKTGYSRDQFGGGWASKNGCDTRDIILNRDLTDIKLNDKCQVVSGVLNDPYTGKTIQFTRGPNTSAAIEIDHVVALSNAWQTGAQKLTASDRKTLANDPLELLAVDGPANIQKSDDDAATWLPPNKPFRCEYVARQIAVKAKYSLWVTSPEKDAMVRILNSCPGQALP